MIQNNSYSFLTVLISFALEMGARLALFPPRPESLAPVY